MRLLYRISLFNASHIFVGLLHLVERNKFSIQDLQKIENKLKITLSIRLYMIAKENAIGKMIEIEFHI